jgi:glycosyltransferase involved in cell wall biosynthesis
MTTEPTNICFPFIGDTIGGSHISSLLLAEALPPEYLPVFCLHQKGKLWEYLVERNHQPLHLPLTNYVGSSGSLQANICSAVSALMPIRRFLKANKISIVHGNDTRSNQTWVLGAKSSHIPFVWHQRTPPALSRITKYLMQASNVVICISNYTLTTLPARCLHKAISIDNPFAVPDPVPDRGSEKNKVTESLGLPNDSILVGFFGNLIDRKRPLDFVDVIHWLHHHFKHRNVVGLMFGEIREGYDDQIRNRARKFGIEQNVKLMGFQRNISHFISGVDYSVATSIDEPFGRTLVESMFLGTPVIATNSGGHREIIEDNSNGLLVPVGDGHAFASAVHRLISDEKLEKSIVGQARLDALQRYSVSNHKTEICRIYSNLLD